MGKHAGKREDLLISEKLSIIEDELLEIEWDAEDSGLDLVVGELATSITFLMKACRVAEQAEDGGY